MNAGMIAMLVLPILGQALLAGNKNKRKSNTLNLPSFKNVLEVKSAIPGRIRFYSPYIKNNPSIVAQAREQIIRLKVVRYVEINPVTGSLLIKYNAIEIEPHLLEAATLKLLGLEEATKAASGSLIGKELKNLGSAFSQSVSDKTGGLLDAKTLIALVLMGVGVFGLLKNPLSIPSGYNFLLWGGQMVFGGKS